MNDSHALGKLIQDALDRNKWSTRDLAKRAADMGQYMSHTNFNRLKNEPLSSIKADTIRLLARVLSVPEGRVTRAALATMGLPHDDHASPDLTDVVRNSVDLSARDRRILESVISAMRSERTETSDADTTNDRTTLPSVEVSPPGGDGAGPEQKTGERDLPSLHDLAAHPPMELNRERFEREHGGAGEESQASPEDE